MAAPVTAVVRPSAETATKPRLRTPPREAEAIAAEDGAAIQAAAALHAAGELEAGEPALGADSPGGFARAAGEAADEAEGIEVAVLGCIGAAAERAALLAGAAGEAALEG